MRVLTDGLSYLGRPGREPNQLGIDRSDGVPRIEFRNFGITPEGPTQIIDLPMMVHGMNGLLKSSRDQEAKANRSPMDKEIAPTGDSMIWRMNVHNPAP